MLLLPLRVDLDLHKIPFVTIAACLLCVVIFFQQYTNESSVIKASEAFCNQPATRMTQMVLDKIVGRHDAEACILLFWDIRLAPDPQARLAEHVREMEPLAGMSLSNTHQFATNLLNERYTDFTNAVPVYKTQSLWYDPHSWNPLTMISAAFAHADWLHLIGNLFFFFAFAAAIEVIVGSLTLFGLILAYAVGTHVFYSLAMVPVSNAPPTLGLSGVVMAMVALFAFFLPRGRIRCFIWIFVFIKRFSLPIWVFAVWFIGWDVFNLFNADDQSGINFVAHVSGAALGYFSGILLFQQRRKEVRAIASGESEDYFWVDEMKHIESLQQSQQNALGAKRLQALLDKYPHRENDLRALRHNLLRQLPYMPEREENARLLMSQLMDSSNHGKAVDVYLDRIKDDAAAVPERPEHYLPILKLLKARREYKIAIRMIKSFHKNYPTNNDTPELYFEAVKICQEELQKPEQAKRIAGYLNRHFPMHPATQRAIELTTS